MDYKQTHNKDYEIFENESTAQVNMTLTREVPNDPEWIKDYPNSELILMQLTYSNERVDTHITIPFHERAELKRLRDQIDNFLKLIKNE